MATKIYIDQGHNPRNPNAGAEGNGLREQDITYDIGLRTAARLRARGLEVRLSRPTSSTQLGTSNASSLSARVNDANSWGADYFISLHTNAAANTAASGSEAYVYRNIGSAASLARNILSQLNISTGLRNRGVFSRPTLYVLKKTQMPATLIEMGFISNSYDADLLANSPYLFSSGVYRGILDYYGML